MARKEFPKAVKVAAIKRATRDGVVYCESCGCLSKKFHIDHINPDGLTGEPTLANARVLCVPCHKTKTAADVAAIAKAKRVEARHVGATTPKAKIASRPKAKRERPEKMPLPPRRSMFVEVD